MLGFTSTGAARYKTRYFIGRTIDCGSVATSSGMLQNKDQDAKPS